MPMQRLSIRQTDKLLMQLNQTYQYPPASIALAAMYAAWMPFRRLAFTPAKRGRGLAEDNVALLKPVRSYLHPSKPDAR